LTIGTESGGDWTVALRRQQARTAEGQPTGCYTNTLKIMCRHGGGDPSRDNNHVPPRLQRAWYLARFAGDAHVRR
jgi:hypothetical protein